MSDEKKPERTKLVYVAFRDQVDLPGVSGLNAWSPDRCKGVEAVEKGNWIVMVVKGQRIRVPMTNVTYLREEVA